MAQLHTKNTDWLLAQWAKWAKQGGVAPQGYGESAMFHEVERLTTSPTRLLICEEDALQIDGIIAQLTIRDGEMAQATMLFYYSDGNASHVARVLSKGKKRTINRKRVDVLVKAGTAWVDAILFLKAGMTA